MAQRCGFAWDMSWHTLGLALSAGGAANLSSQALPLQIGARIRLVTTAFAPSRYAEPTGFDGDLVSMTEDTLFVTPTSARSAHPLPTSRPLAVPVSSIRYLAERTGRRSAWRTGAIIGGIAGTVVGGVIGAKGAGPATFEGGDPIASSAMLGGLGGALVGGLIAAPFKSDRWRQVLTDQMRIELERAQTGTVRAQLAFSF